MANPVYPRQLLSATYDVKEEWSRALLDSFGPGGLLAREAPDFGREHLLWALVQLRCVNGRTGAMFTGDTTISQMLGYNTRDLPGKQCRETLTRFGFFTQHGKKGRAAYLLLSAPVAVLDDYPTLAGAVRGEVVTVPDTKPSRPRKKATSVDGESRPAQPSVNGTGEACSMHPDGACPDSNDPFGGPAPWELVGCTRTQAAEPLHFPAVPGT
ncbi:hypothetical protein ACSNOH_23465 [Streptomyces sp. URMC 127]|uniref:hypothetical protein n=1 Tax=Streptomyces sp. URMC 127 TaxID=3423402 RepID=UPI003F1BCF31